MMKMYNLCLPVLFLIIACAKSTEVTIVETKTDQLFGDVESSEIGQRSEPADFMHITIGEMNPIETLDPLFAESNSELRLVSLLYDGLTRLDENGNPAPAIAEKWTISRDSLRYTFTLRNDAFFHNNSRFSSGAGRKVVAKDVEFAFKRMASAHVPNHAAYMFSNIYGFNEYHVEQTAIKNPAKRVLNEIQGITVRNDTTIVILLVESDSKFLNKLAHPFASVYAYESLSDNSTLIKDPIGTGAYYFAQKQRGKIILASNNGYYSPFSAPDRIDIVSEKTESEVYQDIAKGELDALIEIAPKTILQVSDDADNLNPIYQETFSLNRQEVINKIGFYYNPASGKENVVPFLQSDSSRAVLREIAIGKFRFPEERNTIPKLNDDSYAISFTKNSAHLFLINTLAEYFTRYGASVTLSSTYAVTDNTTFSTVPFSGSMPAFFWDVPVYILSKQNISGISITHEPWNISFEGLKIEN